MRNETADINFFGNGYGGIEICTMDGRPLAGLYPLEIAENAAGIPNTNYPGVADDAKQEIKAVYSVLRDLFTVGLLEAREVMLYEGKNLRAKLNLL